MQYVKIQNKKATIMPRGRKPSLKDDAVEYPGRGDPKMKQWLATFEDDARMPDGRPAPFFIMLLADPKLDDFQVAADAIRRVRRAGFDMSRVVAFRLYPLPEGNEIDMTGIRFFV